ncbi:MAG: TonB-dependent receptor [Chitinophagaceae bacterium]
MIKQLFSILFLGLIPLISFCQGTSSLSGKVKVGKNINVPGATIHLLNTSLSAITDSTGSFVFEMILPGHYTLLISSIGYATESEEIDIKENTPNHIDIVLRYASLNMDEVVVTAQKKEELLQKIPISITSLSTRQLKEYRIWHNNELTGIIPNFYSANSGDDRNVTSIRGITTTSYDPAVATYIDGVNQFGLDTYIANLVDAERIEVLRGPQGSLYGRNAMGGVINIITKQPTNSTTGFAEINFGNYNQTRLSAGVRSPIIKNKLYVGVAGVYQQRNGYYTNTLTNTSYDKQTSFTSNYYLKYIPKQNWNVLVNIKHHINRNKGTFPLVFGVQDALADPFKLAQNALAKMIDNTFNGSLSINHTSQMFNFSSQTAYQSNQRYYNAPLDGDFSPIDGVTVINDYGKEWNKVRVFTQEFKFTSGASSISKIKWTTGIYFFHQYNPTKQTTHFGEDAALVGAPDKNFSVTNTNIGKNTGLAAYGQIAYSLTKKLELIAGIRGDMETKKYTVRGEYQKETDPIIETRSDTSSVVKYNALSPKLGLSYQFDNASNAYVTYSKGFRTGGITQLSTDPTQPPLFSYKPEYSNNWEAGIKNSFWKNALRFNLAFFLTKVKDAQVPTLILPDAITVTKNAGELRSRGVEAEVAMALLPNLQVDFNIGYTDAKYTTLKIAQNGTEVDLSGKKPIFTPSSTRIVAIQYSIPLYKKLNYRFVLRSEFIRIGKQYFDLANTIEQADYNLVNLRLGFTTNKVDLFFWSRNSLDKKYISYAYDFGAVHLGDPKTYGITLSAKF